MGLHAERLGRGPAGRPGARLHPDRPVLGRRRRRPRRGPRGGAASTRRATVAPPRSWRGPAHRRPTSLIRGGGPATYVGYSMGARLCLHVALAHPELVRGLVLLGGTAGIEDPAERAARVEPGPRHRRPHRAARASRRSSTAWLAQPLFAGLPPRAAPASRTAARTPWPGCGRASSWPAPGAQEPLWDRSARCAMPVLVVAGERRRQVRRARPSAWPTRIGANATLAPRRRGGPRRPPRAARPLPRAPPPLARRPRPLSGQALSQMPPASSAR